MTRRRSALVLCVLVHLLSNVRVTRRRSALVLCVLVVHFFSNVRVTRRRSALVLCVLGNPRDPRSGMRFLQRPRASAFPVCVVVNLYQCEGRLVS